MSSIAFDLGTISDRGKIKEWLRDHPEAREQLRQRVGERRQSRGEWGFVTDMTTGFGQQATGSHRDVVRKSGGL